VRAQSCVSQQSASWARALRKEPLGGRTSPKTSRRCPTLCASAFAGPFAANEPPEIPAGSVPAVSAGGASSDPKVPGRAEAPNAGERLVDGMLHDAHLTGSHERAGLISRHAATLGVQDAVAYLVDLQQTVLIPLLDRTGSSGRW
jgi:hypothetical protein